MNEFLYVFFVLVPGPSYPPYGAYPYAVPSPSAPSPIAEGVPEPPAEKVCFCGVIGLALTHVLLD